MIGKYTDEDFFTKLTTDEQREYLLSLTENMTNAQIMELISKVNDVRANKIYNHLMIKDYDDDILSHFFNC